MIALLAETMEEQNAASQFGWAVVTVVVICVLVMLYQLGQRP